MSLTGDADDLDSDPEERVAAELAIAAALAELSAAEMAPNEVDQTTEFAADDVSFEDGSWLEYVGRVQDWLRLPERLHRDVAPASAAQNLFAWLGVEPAGSGLEQNGSLRPSLSGIEKLRERTERAVSLMERFLEEVESLESSGAASASWLEAWDEASEDLTTATVVARATTVDIKDFAYRAKRGRLNLSPTYQRADVWPTKDAQLLIESILRGIPLPSLIILKPDSDDAPSEVVDGKQRLTAILRFMGAHPDALDLVRKKDALHPGHRLEELFRENYLQFRRAWKNATGETLSGTLEKRYYFPFKLSSTSKALVGDLEPLRGKYYFAIREARVRIGGERVDINEVFEGATEYKLPVIEYTAATPRQIHDVFNLYNRQGKHLNAEEIRNAVFHHLALMRALSVASGDNPHFDEATPFLAKVRSDVSDVAQMLSEYRFGDARFRRTKVLSWLLSILLVDSLVDGKPRLLSTSQQINHLLDRVDRDPQDPLHDTGTIADVIALTAQAMEAHSANDPAWAPRFKDNKSGARWQELQLVASLLGVVLASVGLGDQVHDRLEARTPTIRDHTTDGSWQRPDKTQTGTQWRYIARVALGVLDALDVDRSVVDARLRERFSVSCIASLEAAERQAEK